MHPTCIHVFCIQQNRCLYICTPHISTNFAHFHAQFASKPEADLGMFSIFGQFVQEGHHILVKGLVGFKPD